MDWVKGVMMDRLEVWFMLYLGILEIIFFCEREVFGEGFKIVFIYFKFLS